MKNDNSKAIVVTSYEQLVTLFNTPNQKVLKLRRVSENMMLGIVKPHGIGRKQPRNVSLAVGIFTTAQARLKLQKGLNLVDTDKLLYTDTLVALKCHH